MELKTRRLQFAIITDQHELKAWQVRCIKTLLAVDGVELSKVVLYSHENNRKMERLSLFKVTHWIACRWMKSMKMSRISVMIGDAQMIHYDAATRHAALSMLKSCECDFIMDFSEAELPEELMTLGQYGVWRFRHGREKPSSFWEIYDDHLVTQVTLFQKVGGDHHYHILKEGHYATIKDSYSKNLDHIHFSAADWPAAVCRSILHGVDVLGDKKVDVEDAIKTPSMLETMRFMGRLFKHKLQKMINQLFRYEYWNVGIINKPIQAFLQDPTVKIDWLVENKQAYYADPFGYIDEDGIQILMEEVDYKVVKGYITQATVIVTTEPASLKLQSSIIQLPSHLSYPFILQYEGKTYCIPETSEENQVSLYELNEEKATWEKVQTLIADFPAVDATIIQVEGLWWLFCTKAHVHAQSHNSELHLFYAEDLFGSWHPHARNPVKIDIASARPAGTPFWSNGCLYRPAQDCAKTYGGRIVFNRIEALSIHQFSEKVTLHMNPENDSLYPDGIHTISSIGDVTVLDGKRFDYSIFHFIKKLYKFKPKVVGK